MSKRTAFSSEPSHDAQYISADNLGQQRGLLIAEGVEFAAWSPTEPLILMQRRDIKVVKVETTMMDMGGSGMEGMGPSYQQVITDYMVLRKPEDSQAQEKKLAGQALAVSGGRWSPTGVLVSGQAPAARHVFALNPESGTLALKGSTEEEQFH